MRLTTVIADDGQTMTEMWLVVRNNGLQHLEVALPRGATVWSAFVEGEAVRPALSQGKLLLPLEASDTAADTPVTVELTCIVKEKFPSGSREVNLLSPSLNVPLNNARWDLYLPPDFDYQQFAGSMAHEAQAAPAVQSYSLSEYHAQEAQQKAAKQAATTSIISNARANAAISNLKAIDQNKLNWAIGNNSDIATLNAIQDVQKDVDRQQAYNFMSQNRVYQNAQVANVQASAQAVEEANGLQQWSKVAQAQQLAVARVQPLRVNLPTRGLHQGFTQILQTQVDKPLSIRFTAASTGAGGLFRKAFDGALALLLLWAIVRYILSRRPGEQTSA